MIAKRIHNKAVCLFIAGLSLLSSYTYGQKNIDSKHHVYDTIAHRFIDAPRGVDEKILQSIDSIIHYEELDKKFEGLDILKAIQQYDETERSMKFTYLSERLFFQRLSLKRAIKSNFRILKRLDTKKITDLEQNEVGIKILMSRLEEVKTYFDINNTDNETFLALEMYGIINQQLPIYGNYVKQTKNLKYVLNEWTGDCTEYTAAHYALLNFYGIDTYFKMAKAIENDTLISGHAWIHIKVDDVSFDLDPKNIKYPVPLENRNQKEIIPQQLSYLHKRYDPNKRK